LGATSCYSSCMRNKLKPRKTRTKPTRPRVNLAKKPKIPKRSHVSAQPLGHTGSSWSTFEVWARVGGFVTASRAASLRSMETWCPSHGSNKSLMCSTKSTRFLDAFGWFWSRLDWFNLLVSQRTCRTWMNLAQERLVQRPFWGSFDKVQHSQPNSCILISKFSYLQCWWPRPADVGRRLGEEKTMISSAIFVAMDWDLMIREDRNLMLDQFYITPLISQYRGIPVNR